MAILTCRGDQVARQDRWPTEVALMDLPTFTRIPRHVAFIPDGNRRWAQNKGLRKEEGYASGLEPGFQLYDICIALGIEELSVYGFTSDNTKRPPEQTAAFRQACVEAVEGLSKLDAALLVVGNEDSSLFPPELKPYRTRQVFGNGIIRVNFLVNYDWYWDLSKACLNGNGSTGGTRGSFMECIGSSEVSRTVSYTHLRAHETVLDLVCRLLLEKK